MRNKTHKKARRRCEHLERIIFISTILVLVLCMSRVGPHPPAPPCRSSHPTRPPTPTTTTCMLESHQSDNPSTEMVCAWGDPSKQFGGVLSECLLLVTWVSLILSTGVVWLFACSFSWTHVCQLSFWVFTGGLLACSLLDDMPGIMNTSPSHPWPRDICSMILYDIL